MYIPVHHDWRLNERMYGGLTGLNKAETAAKYGDEQVRIWRRSYDTPSPVMDESSEYFPGRDPRYANIPKDRVPRTESLKDTIERFLPAWETEIAPQIRAGKNVLIAAHGNTLRGLIMHLDGLSREEVMSLELPTGVPVVYDLDADLKPRGPRRALTE